MRRRFTRRRRGGSREGLAPIDAARWLGRIREEGVIEASELAPIERDDVPQSYAALGSGRREDGTELVVAFSPHSAGDALLAVLAAARGAAPFTGEAIAVAPAWSAASLARLALVGDLPFEIRAVPAPGLADGNGDIEIEVPQLALPLTTDQVAAQLASPEERALFGRAASALEGLASKHGGAVRGTASSLELVVLAQRVAALQAERGVVLETLVPQRSSLRLTQDDLAGAFDRLEGQLRKRLNDRHVRDGEEGKRSRVGPLLAVARALREVTAWPLGGSDREVIDLVGIDADGYPVVGAVREEIDLVSMGEILDALAALRPVLPLLLAGADPPLRLGAPRIALAAEAFSEAATQVLSSLTLGHSLFQVRSGPRGYELVVVDSAEAAPRIRPGGRDGRGERERGSARDDRTRNDGRGERSDRSGGDSRRRSAEPAQSGSARELEPVARDVGDEEGGTAEAGDEDREGSRRTRRRGRRRRGGRSGEGDGRGSEGGGTETEDRSAPAAVAPLEVSLFDLDDDGRDEDDEGGRPRRRRSRRRGRRAGAGSADDSGRPAEQAGRVDDDGESADTEPAGQEDEDDTVDLDDALAVLSDDAPDFDEVVPEPSYDDDDDIGDDDDGEEERRRIEREKRRRSRVAAPVEPPPPPRPVRRRAAIVAHADRDSLLAAVLLARDLRLIEGIWVYPQHELMTFFRSVTSDLRDDTPICVVGFTPSPAGEVLQMVSLYGERLQWFDHHDWPPEDLGALKATLADDALHVTPGVGSSLPAVLSISNRRSRFSDKLVDLCAGRFTQHDYERWGRVWWWRLGQMAARPGDRRSDVDPLLVGRPSDLAREASRVEAPPVPEEVAYVSQRDFRIVHFAGYSMVVLDIPPEYDLHLSARIARERYGAPFSLARRTEPGEPGELLVLAAEESAGKRSFDLAAVVDHLAQKLDFVQALSDDDHVARFRVWGVAEYPERLDEVVAEIAMGRSLIEG